MTMKSRFQNRYALKTVKAERCLNAEISSQVDGGGRVWEQQM